MTRKGPRVLELSHALRAIAMALVALSFACSRQPEGEFPGNCPLNCSDARIGGWEFDIQPLSGSSSITCSAASAGQAFQSPTRIYFRMVQKSSLSRGSAPTGEEEGGGETASQPSGFDVPAGGISFFPMVQALAGLNLERSEGRESPECTTTPANYCGVWTPRNQWCTDSCGLATVELWLRCPGVGGTDTVSVGLGSGSAATPTDQRISFEITTTDQ